MDLLTYLKENPDARERSNKNKVIAKMIWDRHGVPSPLGGQEFSVTRPTFTDIVAQVLNFDRQWRKILHDNPELRGTDYNDKEMLEVEAQRKLGYPV